MANTNFEERIAELLGLSVEVVRAYDKPSTLPVAARRVREIGPALEKQRPSTPKFADMVRFHRTDAGNAELFAKLFGENLRYDHTRKRWLLWQKNWWAEDPTETVLLLAKQSARWRAQRASTIDDPEERAKQYKWATGSEARSRLEATLKLGQSEPPIADSGRDWDSNPMLLGVKNGVVDLRTGKLRPGKRSDLITMHIDLAFDSKASCPNWTKFLEEIFGGDKQLVAFVQRTVGYCLTGDTREQVLFMCYGTGANGKSTFLDVLRSVFGSYAYNLPFSAFELKARSSIPNEIAALKGKRFVTAIETNESVELNEGRIKALTGSDPITARFLFKEFFTFEPTGKFWLAFNHKPRVSDDSPGFWRRVRLIPFTQHFSEGKRDPGLVDKLKAEAPGILKWATEGALNWQSQGLKAPEVVVQASERYRCDSDTVGEFLDDRCNVSPAGQATAAAIRDGYLRWAQANGERPLDRKSFSQKLEDRGFRKVRKGHDRTRTWLGISLKGLEPDTPVSAPVRADADVKSHLLVN